MRPIKKLDINITDIDVVPNLKAWQESINLIESETGFSLVTESEKPRDEVNPDSLWDKSNRSETRAGLKEQLVSEQQGFCCYCSRKISKENIVIEHLNPKSLFPHIMFSYKNLYASCTGYVDTEAGIRQRTSKTKTANATCCDRRKGNERIFVQPISEDQYITYFGDNRNNYKAMSCEGRVKFLSDGTIKIDENDPKKEDKEEDKEENKTVTTLNLNAERLVEKRYELYEQVEEIVKNLKIKHKDKAELIQQELLNHIQEIQKEIEEHQSIDFAFVKIYFLKEKLNQFA